MSSRTKKSGKTKETKDGTEIAIAELEEEEDSGKSGKRKKKGSGQPKKRTAKTAQLKLSAEKQKKMKTNDGQPFDKKEDYNDEDDLENEEDEDGDNVDGTGSGTRGSGVGLGFRAGKDAWGSQGSVYSPRLGSVFEPDFPMPSQVGNEIRRSQEEHSSQRWKHGRNDGRNDHDLDEDFMGNKSELEYPTDVWLAQWLAFCEGNAGQEIINWGTPSTMSMRYVVSKQWLSQLTPSASASLTTDFDLIRRTCSGSVLVISVRAEDPPSQQALPPPVQNTS
jgi:hypothetical protein